MAPPESGLAPTETQVEQFLRDGYLRVDEAFPNETAAECRRVLWLATGCSADDPSTWTRPVVRIGEIPHPAFASAANTPRLTAAYDALVGAERWLPRRSLGTFPIRFPSDEDPGDCGWHVDMSFGHEEEPDFMKWRVNVASKGRALLMLFLFSDVGESDAPTRLRVGSHRDVARKLAPHGSHGSTFGELASNGFDDSSHRPEALASGPAGTVYLCHPFLVHSAQPLGVGRRPRFMGQPALFPREPLDPWRENAAPVERAIAMAIEAT